jgi:hypothetical protein
MQSRPRRRGHLAPGSPEIVESFGVISVRRNDAARGSEALRQGRGYASEIAIHRAIVLDMPARPVEPRTVPERTMAVRAHCDSRPVMLASYRELASR